MWSRVPRSLVLLATAVGFAVACSDDETTSPTSDPLAGLIQSEERDSIGNGPPPPPPSQEPGYFRGRVLGQSDPEPGQNTDTLATAPRIANVRVTAYPRVSNDPTPKVGPEAASVVTDAEGAFQFPLLPYGEYVVTFNPPENSEYRGVWVTTVVHNTSHEWPWWIVLPKK